jgi:hypothetical protein
LRFQGRERVHNADEIMAERAGFIVMKRPAIRGGATLGRGFER